MSVKKTIILVAVYLNLLQTQPAFCQLAEGLTGRLNARGIEFVREQVTSSINESVHEFVFPVFEGVLLVSYRIENLNLFAFDLGDTFLRPEQPSHLVVGVQSAEIGFSGSFFSTLELLFASFNISGDVSVLGSNINISQRIELRRTDAGVLSVGPAGCNATIGSFTPELNNFEPEFLGDLIVLGLDQVSEGLRTWLSEVICDTIESTLNDSTSPIFGSLDGTIPLPFSNWNIEMDATLSRNPVVTDSSVELGAAGRCYPSEDSALTENFPIPIVSPLTTPSNAMFQLQINEYVINTFLASLHSRGILGISVPSSDLQKIVGNNILLNRDFLSLFNPTILTYTSVNNSTPFLFTFQPVSAPTVAIRDGSFSVIGSYEIEARFNPVNHLPIEVNIMQLDFDITASLTASGDVLSWQILNVEYDFPGTPEPLILIFQFNTTLILNVALSPLRGTDSNPNQFVLPTFGGYAVDFDNLQLKENAVEVMGDFAYVGGDDNDDVLSIDRTA